MALQEVARRTIENFGILKLSELDDLSQGESSEWTRLEIWTVVRKIQSNPYVNKEWKPERGFYGRLTISADNTLALTNPPIIHAQGIEYKIQRIYQWNDYTRIINSHIECATQKILESIAALGTAQGIPATAISGMPQYPATRFQGQIVRVVCESDSIIDIVVLAENAFNQLSPQDAICLQFVPTPFADAIPAASNPDNALDNTPDVPGDDPAASPPYDPLTRDDGETPNDNIAPPLPGQRGRITFSGQVALGTETETRPISGSIQPYIPPISAAWIQDGMSSAVPGAPTYALHVYDGLGQDNIVLTAVRVRCQYVLSYYTP